MDKLFHPPQTPSASRFSLRSCSPLQSMKFDNNTMESLTRSSKKRPYSQIMELNWRVVSAVNCASRGWINVDIDTISCEACGARLLSLLQHLGISNSISDNFREHCFALLQLSALPRISPSAIDYMQSQSTLLEDFLGQSLMLEYGNGSAENSGIGDVSSQEELKLYYQAQKLISLCGWKLRPLPYVVDWKDMSDQSLNNTTNLVVHSAGTNEHLKTDESSKDSIGEQMDPNSAVLDCSLCGATIGLWAFCTVPRPVESIRLVGYAEVNGENADLENRQGGSSPTKQNFKAIISLPIIGQNLRARLSYDSDFRDHVFVDRGGIQSDLQEKTDNIVNAFIGQLVPVSSEIREISNFETGSQSSLHDSDVLAGQSSALKDKMPVHTDADKLNSSAAGYPSSSQKDSTEGEAPSVSHKTLDGQVGSLENYGVKDREENPISRDNVLYSLGKLKNPPVSDKAMEFDPIRQHRHFCPWIASINDGEPGWKQTLSALYHQKNHLPHSPNRSPSSMPIVKVDDPVGSIRKLFMSPPTKRLKSTHITGQNT
ncbi:hypothetical protein D0Y65_010975 [Glycine soja]|uniref:Uncharacterized protein n=1 Tax=Glycine soja TaxID=3848 RepID=A0A445KIK8_GLYSO|nr:hypothetical protein D0Y65_010975 [Glycine soja]